MHREDEDGGCGTDSFEIHLLRSVHLSIHSLIHSILKQTLIHCSELGSVQSWGNPSIYILTHLGLLCAGASGSALSQAECGPDYPQQGPDGHAGRPGEQGVGVSGKEDKGREAEEYLTCVR